MSQREMSHAEPTRGPHAECRGSEAALSAVVDGELDSVELLSTLDHLADCEPCREFYRRARRLDGAVLAFAAARDSATPPPAVWERIASRGAPAPTVSRRRWLARLAAILMLALGIWALQRTDAGSGRATPGEIEVVLASDGGRMDQERFVELAAEVLEADRSFHYKMLEVMTAATRYESREGSADAWRERSEDRRREGGEPERRDWNI